MADCPVSRGESVPSVEPAAKTAPPANAQTARLGRFAQIVDQHQGPLLRYVARMAGCGRDQAEDVVQECFLRLHRAWGASAEPPMERVGAWLFTVAHNITTDLIRKDGHRRAAQSQPAAEQNSADELSALNRITQSEAAAAALSALDRLPPSQKQVVLMKLIQGLTFRQIAKATGLSLGGVNHCLNQALATLARQLRQSGHM